VFDRPVVMMVTDRRYYHDGAGRGGDPAEALVRAAERAARAGVDFVQLRERGLEDGALLRVASRVCEVAAAAGSRTIVNDRVDVALIVGAAGVHLPAAGIPPARVRTIVPEGFLVGRSVHDEDEAAAIAQSGSCDYLIFGSVFETASKPAGHVVAGLGALSRVCARVRLPVLAVGGITPARVREVAQAGAAGVAAIGMFAEPDQQRLTETVASVREAFAGVTR
jgi:thiamine-phosphate diphosphorylase